MSMIYSTQNISTLQNRKVFFDANILVYVFWPTGSHSWERVYSTAFRNLLRQQNNLFVDFIVISEIINRIIRLEYEKHLMANNISKNDLRFKKYRDCSEGQTALSDIYLIIESNILNRFTIIGKSFTKAEILSFLTLKPLDFADKGILLTCKENDCVFFTNDVDYKTADIDILTSNPAILKN